jgi:uncharacterized phiE125 gp8 family phage protein
MPALPVPIDLLRTRLRIEVEDDDALLASLAIAAGELIEKQTGLALASSTRTAKLKPWRRWCAPVQPMASVTSVTYVDPAGSTQTLPTAEWYVDETDELPVLLFDTTASTKENTYATVTYVAGYTVIPHALQQCIVALVGAWYANPEAASVASLQSVPLAYQFIIDHYSARSALR